MLVFAHDSLVFALLLEFFWAFFVAKHFFERLRDDVRFLTLFVPFQSVRYFDIDLLSVVQVIVVEHFNSFSEGTITTAMLFLSLFM